MLHTKREWCVVPVTRRELVEHLAGRAWNLCAGFYCEGALWLNDSLSRDNAQMFAVVRRDVVSGEWRQLDVFSVAWMARDRLRELLDDLPHMSGWAIEAPQIDWVDDSALCRECA
jgi:hypothetical protein